VDALALSRDTVPHTYDPRSEPNSDLEADPSNGSPHCALAYSSREGSPSRDCHSLW